MLYVSSLAQYLHVYSGIFICIFMLYTYVTYIIIGTVYSCIFVYIHMNIHIIYVCYMYNHQHSIFICIFGYMYE